MQLLISSIDVALGRSRYCATMITSKCLRWSGAAISNGRQRLAASPPGSRPVTMTLQPGKLLLTMDSTRLLLREQPYSRATQHDHDSKQYTNRLRHRYARYHYGDGALHHPPRTQILLKLIRPSRAPFQTLLWDTMNIHWHKGLLLLLSQYQLSNTPLTALLQLQHLLTQTQHRQG